MARLSQIKNRRPHRGLRSERQRAISARTAERWKAQNRARWSSWAARSAPRVSIRRGALFAFEKPISVEQAVRTLSAARSMILDGRLRYHRAGLEVPVSLNCKGQKPMDAFLVNLSQGGMQIHTKDPVEPLKACKSRSHCRAPARA